MPRLATAVAEASGRSQGPALLRLVIGESRTFPDLAQIGHDNVASRTLARLAERIRRARTGEVRAGDPLAHAFSIIGPMVPSSLFREVFGSTSAYSPDLETLAQAHAQTVLRGLMVAPDGHAQRGEPVRSGGWLLYFR